MESFARAAVLQLPVSTEQLPYVKDPLLLDLYHITRRNTAEQDCALSTLDFANALETEIVLRWVKSQPVSSIELARRLPVCKVLMRPAYASRLLPACLTGDPETMANKASACSGCAFSPNSDLTASQAP